MLINNKHYRTIWVKDNDNRIVQVIDQRFLPHKLVIEDLCTVDDVVAAIRDMHIRGAGLIGVTAAFGIYIACLEAKSHSDAQNFIIKSAERIKATRPTAVNLEWAVNRQLSAIKELKTLEEKIEISKKVAFEIAEEDVKSSRAIGENGATIIEKISKNKHGETVNVLTHCNAGWLAFVDHGTAIAPIYEAFEKGIKLHVWVDETRPRNQGANLTAWELLNQGVPHTIIADNTGGHLMQKGLVDMVITGADRVSANGDAANKIGTYLKALAAKDNNIPFYIALPSSTIDWNIKDGIKGINIEERGSEEVKYVEGICNGEIKRVLIAPEASHAANYGFDVTPARLITGFITERGICEANEDSLRKMFKKL